MSSQNTSNSSSSGSTSAGNSGSGGYTVTSSGTNDQVGSHAFAILLHMCLRSFIGKPLLLSRLRLWRLKLQLLPLLQHQRLVLLQQP